MGDQESDFRDLLARARAGEHEAGDALARWLERALEPVASRQLNGPARRLNDTADIVQLALQRVLAGLERCDFPNRASLLAYAADAVASVVKDEVSKAKAARRDAGRDVPLRVTGESGSGELPLTGSAPTPSADVRRRELRRILQECWQELPEPHGTICRLRFVEELSWEEVGAQVDKSADAARVAMARVRVLLVRLLAKRGARLEDFRGLDLGGSAGGVSA